MPSLLLSLFFVVASVSVVAVDVVVVVLVLVRVLVLVIVVVIVGLLMAPHGEPTNIPRPAALPMPGGGLPPQAPRVSALAQAHVRARTRRALKGVSGEFCGDLWGSVVNSTVNSVVNSVVNSR